MSPKSEYNKLADQFPDLGALPQTFKFDPDSSAIGLHSPLINSIVCPVGRVEISDDLVLLIANDPWEQGEAPWGDMVAYSFFKGELVDSAVVAHDFSLAFSNSVLSADFVLTVTTDMLDTESGEDLVSAEQWKLNEMTGKWEGI